jgi:hypothetical protein
MAEAETPVPKLKERLVIHKTELSMKVEALILRTKPYLLYRWLVFVILAIVFLLRLILENRFYTIGYITGLYFVNCLVLFLSPKLDPDLYGREALPTVGDGDYRPFVRKLPEFVFWRRCFNAFAIAHIATFFRILDPPVFGPLLLVYFLLVVALNFRSRIAHMIRNRYLPFDTGKENRKKDAK